MASLDPCAVLCRVDQTTGCTLADDKIADKMPSLVLAGTVCYGQQLTSFCAMLCCAVLCYKDETTDSSLAGDKIADNM